MAISVKQLCGGVLIAALAGAAVPQVGMANDGRNTAAIAGIIAGGIIGAAIGRHQHDQGYPEYRPHPDVPPGENAVGACVHYGSAQVKAHGGYRFEMDKLLNVNHSGKVTTVTMVATRYFPRGEHREEIVCVVENHRVLSFTRT